MRKRSIITEYNDFLADKYDAATQGKFSWLAPKKLVKHIKPYIRSGLEVLDIGVGTGQTSKIFIDCGTNVTGIDLSNKMLAIARAKYPYKKLIKYNVEQGLLNLFPRKKFDIIVAIGILEFIENTQDTLNAMKLASKVEGIIAFTYEVYEPNNKYGIKKVSLLGAGLENDSKLLNFKVYRKTPNEIDNILKKLSLEVISREKFTGYFKSQLKIPVPYELLVVRKKVLS